MAVRWSHLAARDAVGNRHSRSCRGPSWGEGTNFPFSLGVTTRESDVGDPH